MKVVKPHKLSVLTRCFEHERQCHLGVSVLAFVPLTEGQASLLSEVSLWTFVADRMGEAPVLDAGVPKCRAEFLVHGSAFSPGAQPCSQLPVRATVGDLRKSLQVTGDRFWRTGRRASEAHPFTQMPLDWSRAYGGPEFSSNPVGRGHGESEIEGERVTLLPNVELPDQRVAKRSQEVEPGGFGQIDLSWPQRQALAGTYDGAWLEEQFPGFARDIDWGFFNIAPRDQQRDAAWSGGEAYCFENLHPTRPQLHGRIPRLAARAFVTRELEVPTPAQKWASKRANIGTGPAQDGETCFEEVGLRLQTLWFFPDAERAVLIYQGSIPITTEDGADVRHLVLAAEHQGEQHRRPIEHYARVLAERLDPKRGGVAALREHELLPEGMGGPIDELAAEQSMVGSEGLMAANLHRGALLAHDRIVDELTVLGIDPSMHPDPPTPPGSVPSLEELPAFAEKALAEAEAHRERAAKQEEELRAEVDSEVEAAGIDAAALREQQETPQTGPPTWTAAAQRQQLKAAIAECEAGGSEAPEFVAMLADAELQASWEEAERSMREGYRQSAHFQTPAPARARDQRRPLRAFVLAALEAGEAFSTLNLSGVDLAGMDLRGADLRGALLEGVNLDGADLSGADLSDAILAHGSLRGATLDGCVLRRTNLGKAQLGGASLRRALLHETILHGADLSDVALEDAEIKAANLMEVVLSGADASGLKWEGLTLIEVQALGLGLAGAWLPGGTFIKMDLAGVDFAGAELSRCTFVSCELSGANFEGATLTGARFVEACNLDGAVFSHAELGQVNLRGTSMKGADFSHATLEGADLCECDLTDAVFYRALAQGARFDRADLTGASFLAANLMQVSLTNAVLYGADMRGANLHGADMARVRSDASLRLDDALLTKVRIHPTYAEAEVHDAPR